tara:strand:+ start:734 stop:901 length:168 start_codon:yes stop_codon:yes gene_type:complete
MGIDIKRDYSADKPEDLKAKEKEKKDMWKRFFSKGGVIEKVPYRVTKEQLKKGKW